jgi:mono/diheme cytochrome c family protein
VLTAAFDPWTPDFGKGIVMLRSGTVMLVSILCFVLLVASGCNKKEEVAATVPAAGPPPGGPRKGGPPGVPTPQEVLSHLPGGDEFAPGKKVYADQNCVRCHRLGQTGGAPMGGRPEMMPGGPKGASAGGRKGGPPGGMSGPDLSGVGAIPGHDEKWLAAHIRDPKQHNRDSTMPAFAPDKINDAELGSLAVYLASRKDTPPAKDNGGGKDGKDGKEGAKKDPGN